MRRYLVAARSPRQRMYLLNLIRFHGRDIAGYDWRDDPRHLVAEIEDASHLAETLGRGAMRDGMDASNGRRRGQAASATVIQTRGAIFGSVVNMGPAIASPSAVPDNQYALAHDACRCHPLRTSQSTRYPPIARSETAATNHGMPV